MSARMRALRVILAVAALPPLGYGIAAATSGQAIVEISATLSSASVTLTPELEYLLKPLGLYIAMFGALLAYAIVDPVRHRAIVTWGGLVLLARAIQRLAVTRTLHEVFQVPVALNLFHVAYLFAISLTLLALRPRGPQCGDAPQVGADYLQRSGRTSKI